MPLNVATEVNEGSACQLSFTFQDFDGVAIQPDTATMSLYVKDSTTVINSRSDLNVISYFTAGVFEFKLTNADNAIIDTTGTHSFEMHTAVFKLTATIDSMTVHFKETIDIKVLNLSHIT
jgi:hypothetical protein